MRNRPSEKADFVVFLDGDESNTSPSNVITEDFFYETFTFLNYAEMMDVYHDQRNEIRELQAQLQLFRNLYGIGAPNDIKHFH